MFYVIGRYLMDQPSSTVENKKEVNDVLRALDLITAVILVVLAGLIISGKIPCSTYFAENFGFLLVTGLVIGGGVQLGVALLGNSEERTGF